MTDESKRQLTEFIRRADRVERSAYLRKVFDQGGTEVKFSWKRGEGGSYSSNVPDEEALEALILTARMFVQDNDPVSFRNMSKLANDPGISEGWKDRMRDVRYGLNGYLDAASMLDIDGKRYSHREVFYTFLYGGLAHTDKDLAPVFELWKSNPLGFPVVEWEFHQTVLKLLGAASYLAKYSRMELAGEAIPPIPKAGS